MLVAANSIDIYGSGINLHLAHDFAYKMARIHRQVQIGLDHQHQILSAAIPQSNHCAIIISYSGETFTTVQYAKSLHEMKVPIISITCTGQNSVAKYADERLYIATLEKQFSKIGSFASCTSITAILNYLYCGIFQLNYEKLLSTVLRATAFRSQTATLREDF